MSRPFQVAALMLFCLSAAHADQPQIEDALRSDLLNRIVVLRGFYTGTNLRFDSSGKPLGRVNPGFWSSDGLIYITNISLAGDGRLFLRGKRAIYALNPSQCRMINLTATDIAIAVQLDSSRQDATSARTLVDKIILRDLQGLKDIVPDYWQPFNFDAAKELQQNGSLCGKAEPPKNAGASPNPKVAARELQEEADGVKFFVLEDGTKVYPSGSGVQPPKLLKHTDPSYTDAASRAGIQGSSILWAIVDERGGLKTVKPARVLGGGLDDEAVQAVKKWRFSPATYKGKPVSVEINIEVNFQR